MVTGNLIYLIVLLCGVIALYFGGRREQNLGQMAKYGLIWGGIFLALLAGIALIDSIFGGSTP